MKKAYLTKERIKEIKAYNKIVMSLEDNERDSWCVLMQESGVGIPIKRVSKEYYVKMVENDKYHDYEFDYSTTNFGVDSYIKQGLNYTHIYGWSANQWNV